MRNLTLEPLCFASRWRQKRNDAMQGARNCREALTRADGSYRYALDDQRVKDAVAVWVDRARHANYVAMGLRPVLPKVVVIGGGVQASGPVYVEAEKPDLFDLVKSTVRLHDALAGL